jgi:hypothetical protein
MGKVQHTSKGRRKKKGNKSSSNHNPNSGNGSKMLMSNIMSSFVVVCRIIIEKQYGHGLHSSGCSISIIIIIIIIIV